MQSTLEVTAAQRKLVKRNASVYPIWKQSLLVLYRSYRAKLIDKEEYQVEYVKLLYKCTLMAS